MNSCFWGGGDNNYKIKRITLCLKIHKSFILTFLYLYVNVRKAPDKGSRDRTCHIFFSFLLLHLHLSFLPLNIFPNPSLPCVLAKPGEVGLLDVLGRTHRGESKVNWGMGKRWRDRFCWKLLNWVSKN